MGIWEFGKKKNNDIIIITNMREGGILFSYLSSPSHLAKKLWVIKTSDIIRSRSNFELQGCLYYILYANKPPLDRYTKLHATDCEAKSIGKIYCHGIHPSFHIMWMFYVNLY